MEITYNELRCKEVINVINGKRLGRIVDLVISCENTKVLGIVVPGDKRIFRSKDDIFIPWRNIVKIGDDTILISLQIDNFNCACQRPQPYSC
ncbi:MAG: YlmC/YmxH family sporulation protein, partial [Clostridia bacterium]